MAGAGDSGELQKGLRQRHMTMISLGGVIGAGLFVGSSAVITQTGPGSVALLRRRRPARGPGHADARRDGGRKPAAGLVHGVHAQALGDRGGFTVGWLYWYFWAIVLAVEAVAGAEILQNWLPGVPMWLMSLVLMTVLTATNLSPSGTLASSSSGSRRSRSRRSSSFIAIGVGYLLGIGGGDSPGLSNLTSHGGFFPEGGVTVLSGIVVVIFAFVGAEIVTIAAASPTRRRRPSPRRPTRSSGACSSSTC